MLSICYIATYLNHHLKPVCDAFYELTGGHFFYVATSNIGEMRKNMGFSQMEADYLLDYANAQDKKPIQLVIDSADVVIIGASEPVQLVRKRLNEGKLTFRGSERLFKTRSRYLKAPVHWLRCLLTRKSFMLCTSNEAARDYKLLGFYKKRSYKWGYFTDVRPFDSKGKWPEFPESYLNRPVISFLWVGRLINWKHPEAAVMALKRVKDAGYSFDFTIVGDGPVAPELRELIKSLQLDDCVHMVGARSTEEVRKYMEESEVYLFTSNREEGWGAVLNESMSCACAVVANSEIGSVPFLLKNGENGLVYQKGSIDGLTNCILSLMESYPLRRMLGMEAYRTISEEWSPRKAATNFLQLVDALQNNRPCPIKSGPGSPL